MMLNPSSLPERRLRLAMHGALIAIAIALSTAGWAFWQAELQLAREAKLINVAGISQIQAKRGRRAPAMLVLVVTAMTRAGNSTAACSINKG